MTLSLKNTIEKLRGIQRTKEVFEHIVRMLNPYVTRSDENVIRMSTGEPVPPDVIAAVQKTIEQTHVRALSDQIHRLENLEVPDEQKNEAQEEAIPALAGESEPSARSEGEGDRPASPRRLNLGEGRRAAGKLSLKSRK